MPEMPVPRAYVERLESELNTLGWLAREDKIEFEHEGGSTQVYLKEAVGTNNFFF